MAWGSGNTMTRVERWDVRRDGPLSEAAVERKMSALGFEVVARVYPASAIERPPVNHGVALVGIVHGVVKLTIDGESSHLTAGDLAFVPRGAVRRLEAVGPVTALCLEALPNS